MNVLLLSQFFSTTKGGGEYVFKMIAENLAKNDNKVWVITSKIKDEIYKENKNIKIITVKPEIEYKGGLPPSFSDNIRYVYNAYKEAKSILKTEKIDIIHSNNFSPALAGSIISYFTKIPHVTTIHDIFSTYDKNFWKSWAKQAGVSYTNARLTPFFERLLLKLKIDCIHTVSEATKKDIQTIGTYKPIHVVPNCIQDRISINKDVKKEQFVYLGRLVFYKNLEVILRAIKIVTKEFPNTKLIIAGDGPHKKSIKETIENLNLEKNAILAGHVSENEKEEILAESNAMLFPSMTEGFGLVILESFQQKKPVLVSDIPPMSEIIQDEKTGFVIDPHNEKMWAEKIIRLIKEPTLSEKMGVEGNQILQSKYNQDLFNQNIVKMYNSVQSL